MSKLRCTEVKTLPKVTMVSLWDRLLASVCSLWPHDLFHFCTYSSCTSRKLYHHASVFIFLVLLNLNIRCMYLNEVSKCVLVLSSDILKTDWIKFVTLYLSQIYEFQNELRFLHLKLSFLIKKWSPDIGFAMVKSKHETENGIYKILLRIASKNNKMFRNNESSTKPVFWKL